MRHAISCPKCGAKFRADRGRCPRCRTVLAGPADPAAVARSSRRLIQISVGMAIAFAAIVAGLWITSPPADKAAPSRPPADPLASRRQAPAPKAEEAIARPDEDRSFVEPSAAGGVSYSAGNLPGALAQFQDAVKKNPEDAESWSNLGQVLVKSGQAEEALPAFQRAIDLVPGRWAYRFNQARALGILGRLDESVDAYRAAQQLFPNDYATAFNLGLTLHKKGDEEAAVAEYKKAIELSPEEASFHMALALSYERLQKPVEAAAAYTEALKLSPSAPDADKVRARIAQLTGQPATTPSAPATSPGT
jgi:Flp pilus assembly protein TadD